MSRSKHLKGDPSKLRPLTFSRHGFYSFAPYPFPLFFQKDSPEFYHDPAEADGFPKTLFSLFPIGAAP